MSGARQVTTIRSNPLPLSGQGPHTQDNGKLAAQRQFFAAALRQAQGSAAPTATSAVAVPAAQAPIVQPAQTSAAQPADSPQKVLRPGSLLDIRV